MTALAQPLDHQLQVSSVCSNIDSFRKQQRRASRHLISGGRSGRHTSVCHQVNRLQQHGLRLALHRHLVPPLGRVEVSRHAAPPVKLGPPLEAEDAHAAAREVGNGCGGRSVRHRCGRLFCRLPLSVLPQQLRCRGVLVVLGPHECRPSLHRLQQIVGLGVEQHLHDRGVDARASLQKHPHHRLLPSPGGPYQQRPVTTIVLCATRVHAAALVQPRSHGLRTALVRREKHGVRKPLLHRLPLGVLSQHLRCRGVLVELGIHECRAAVDVLQRGVGLGVEQHLHDRGVVIGSSLHQGGDAAGVMQVDARAALQQHPHHRLLPSLGGRHHQRHVIALCASRVYAAAPVQPRSDAMHIALLRCVPHGKTEGKTRSSDCTALHPPRQAKTLHTPTLGPRHNGHCSPMVAEHASHRHLWPHGKMRCVRGSTQHTMQRWSPDASDAGADSLIALGGTSSNDGGGYTTLAPSTAGSSTDDSSTDWELEVAPAPDGASSSASCAARASSASCSSLASCSCCSCSAKAESAFFFPFLSRLFCFLASDFSLSCALRPRRCSSRSVACRCCCSAAASAARAFSTACAAASFASVSACIACRCFSSNAAAAARCASTFACCSACSRSCRLALGRVCSGLLNAPLPLVGLRLRFPRGRQPSGVRRRYGRPGLRLSRRYGRPGLRLSHLSLAVLPQQLCYRGVLLLLGCHECRATKLALQRGVGRGVEQRLHDRGVASEGSAYQCGDALTVRRLTLAPRCSSIRTIASCPPSAATVSIDVPPHSWLRASTPPPPSSHAATTSALPSFAATHTTWGNSSCAAAGLGEPGGAAVSAVGSSCCRSTCAVAVCLLSSANMSAVLPVQPCSEASALASSSTCTIVVWPRSAAAIRAVPPVMSCRLTLAPRCSSIRTIASCPP
eukprot:scaffold13977_cov67-Phaeocystis_antarctica.AAC.1